MHTKSVTSGMGWSGAVRGRGAWSIPQHEKLGATRWAGNISRSCSLQDNCCHPRSPPLPARGFHVFLFVSQLKSAGKQSSITGFNDQGISNGKVVLDLVDAVKPNSVDYKLVKQGSSDQVRVCVCVHGRTSLLVCSATCVMLSSTASRNPSVPVAHLCLPCSHPLPDLDLSGSRADLDLRLLWFPQEKLDNAKLAISMARKIGARVYALPEDIVEVKPKMVRSVRISAQLNLNRNAKSACSQASR